MAVKQVSSYTLIALEMTALPPHTYILKHRHVLNLTPYFLDTVIDKLSYVYGSQSALLLLAMRYFSKLTCHSSLVVFLKFSLSNAAIEYFW